VTQNAPSIAPLILIISTSLAGCFDNDRDVKIDDNLRVIINNLELTGNPAASRLIPSIDAPLPQLGKKLFFTKSLGGDFDSACVTCHHPFLGGGDNLSLSVAGTGTGTAVNTVEVNTSVEPLKSTG
jgi:cytochrome c peroxidase